MEYIRYMAILHQDKDSAFGLEIPDLPGVFAAADSLEELDDKVQEAVELWAEGQEGFDPPEPSLFADVTALPQAKEGTPMIVRVDYGFLEKKSVPVNVTMPPYMRNRIDRAAKNLGMTRSGLVAAAAQEYIQRHAGRPNP